MQPAAAKRRLSAAAVCRIAFALALALIVIAIFQWEGRLPGIPYLREQAHNIHHDTGDVQRLVPEAATENGTEPLQNDADLTTDDDELRGSTDQRIPDRDDGGNPEDPERDEGIQQHDNDNEPEPNQPEKGNKKRSSRNDDAQPPKGNNEPPQSDGTSPPPADPRTDPLLPSVQQGRKNGPGQRGKGSQEGNSSEHDDNGSADKDGGSAPPAKLKDEPCLKYIVYDKPVKTGSSAITAAIRSYLETIGQTADACTRDECTEMAQAICAGKQKPRALIGHMFGEAGLLECLRKRGFYVVTSVRKPLERWESAFLFNRKKEGNHYGIPHEKGYKFFMQKFPSCSLYQYYDNTDARCQITKAADRLKPIVDRYDEIIDLYEEGQPRGQLFQIISKYLQEVNKSPRPDEGFREPFDKSRLEDEAKLYKALKERGEEILKTGQTPLC